MHVAMMDESDKPSIIIIIMMMMDVKDMGQQMGYRSL